MGSYNSRPSSRPLLLKTQEPLLRPTGPSFRLRKSTCDFSMASEQKNNPWEIVVMSSLYPTRGSVPSKCPAGQVHVLKGGQGLVFRLSTEAQRMHSVSCFLGGPLWTARHLQGQLTSLPWLLNMRKRPGLNLEDLPVRLRKNAPLGGQHERGTRRRKGGTETLAFSSL